MLSISSANLDFAGGWVRLSDRRRDRVTTGLICSVLLHLLVAALLIFGLPGVTSGPPDIEEAIPAELVTQGETTAPSQPQTNATIPPTLLALVETPQPQPHPADIAPPEPPKPAPMAQAPPVPAPAPPKPKLGPKPVLRSEAEAPPPDMPAAPAPPTELPYTEFKSGETIEQNAPTPPSAAAPSSRVASNRPTKGNTPGVGGTATQDIRDVIRIQIEPRWHPDLESLGSSEWVVTIHMVINPDGTIDRADIVDDPRLATDPAFRAFAISARNAVRDSSPLRLPAEVGALHLDMFVKFSSAAARR
jgi:outer membrane biosynthesis protein TonB